ncbi:MAG: hypothetical protein A2Z20_10310 [Bdellovibrionales bacterium RBG_16_40_8]|nr:MAG: hypothetical protein A2Z20_10310 [Bdellovibrionales bacterium RBG_16_40_8]
MPKVIVKKQSQVTAQDAYNKVKVILEADKDLRKLDPSYKCTFNDSAFTGAAAGKLFKADMTVKNQSNGCEVEIVIDLPFALTLAKGLVQKTLQKKLDDSLT